MSDLIINISNYHYNHTGIDNVICYDGEHLGTFWNPIQMSFWDFKRLWLTMLRFLDDNAQALSDDRELDHLIIPLLDAYRNIKL